MSGIRAPITRRAGGRVRRRRAEVGRPARRRHLRGQPLELTAPDVFEVLARRVVRRLLVEEDRDPEACRRRAAPTSLRERDAVGHRDAFDRHERHDVDGAEPRMLAAVAAAGRSPRTAARTARAIACFERRGVAGQREHRAVVRGIGGVVEQADAGRARGPPATSRSTTSGRRPSLTLGMDSMIGMGSFVSRLEASRGRAIIRATAVAIIRGLLDFIFA